MEEHIIEYDDWYITKDDNDHYYVVDKENGTRHRVTLTHLVKFTDYSDEFEVDWSSDYEGEYDELIGTPGSYIRRYGYFDIVDDTYVDKEPIIYELY